MARRGLGRGLGALLATDVAEAGLTRVPLDLITPNPYQPRRAIGADELAELAASIRQHGLIQPLVVTRAEDGYQLIAGERRWRAAREAGLDAVPVVVRDAAAHEMLALAIIENVQRTDLDPLEAADAYRRLMAEFNLTQADVAELVGKSRAAVGNTVRLLGLEPEVQDLMRSGALDEGHGRALLGIEDSEERVRVARRAATEAWSVRQVETAARTSSPAKAPRRVVRQRSDTDPHVAAVERALEARLGTRVEIRRRGQAGQLVVHFYSDEELNALVETLTRA